MNEKIEVKYFTPKIGGPAKEPNYQYMAYMNIGKIVVAVLLLLLVIWLISKHKKIGYLLVPIAAYQLYRIDNPMPLDISNTEGSYLEEVKDNFQYAKEQENRKNYPSVNLGQAKFQPV